MKKRFSNHIKNMLLPCVGFSMAAGFLSALLATAFKLAADAIIHLSTTVYGEARANPVLFPLIILGTALIGFVSSAIISSSHSCRGGGIPTSIAAIRGIVSFKWLTSIILLPFSALLTFFCGIPLGTEGPCVQMGTAVGGEVVKHFGKEKHKGWSRYIMTGGATAGFSIAASSPLTAIIFSMEELHKHFSPLLLTVASLSVLAAQIASQTLAAFGIGSTSLFGLPVLDALTPRELFAPLIVGLICGVASIFFTRSYRYIDGIVRKVMKRISPKIALPVIFVCISVVGFFLSDALGTGHHLTDHLLHTSVAFYLLILLFLIRMVFMMVANTSGVTGGIFLPTIAFGAILGSLCAEGLIALGWIEPTHYTVIVVLGIASFLGSTSRIPLTACVFTLEALGAINNVLPVIIATTAAMITVELSGLEDFTDTVLESKIEAISKGKNPTVIVAPITVMPDSFVVGKEIHDILWPNACTIVAYKHANTDPEKNIIGVGDVISVRYETFNPASTYKQIKALVGKQDEEIEHIMNPRLKSSE